MSIINYHCLITHINSSSSLKLMSASASASATAAADRKMWVIHCLDDLSCGMVDNGSRWGGSIKRMEFLTEHRAAQARSLLPESDNYIRKIGSGPMESDDGKYMIGSMFIVDSTREEVDRFLQNDPFKVHGVWGQITVTRWMSMPNGIKAVRVEKDGEDMNTARMVTDW